MSEEASKLFKENVSVPRLPLWAFLGAFVLTVLATQLTYRTALQRRPQREWTKNNWFSNPFNNPAAFRQLGGFAFTAMGLTGWLFSAHKGQPEMMNLFFISVGLGLIIGSTIFFNSTRA